MEPTLASILAPARPAASANRPDGATPDPARVAQEPDRESLALYAAYDGSRYLRVDVCGGELVRCGEFDDCERFDGYI